MNDQISDQQIEQSLRVINQGYLPYFFKRLLINSEKQNFFAETILTTNLLEMAFEMIGYFTKNQFIKYHLIHLVDKFYRKHLSKVIEEYRGLKSNEEKVNNSWCDILTRLRRQISFRLATCIFITINYYHQSNSFKLRVLDELAYDLNIVTLLDVVLFLQSLLKFNIDLDTEFYFPHLYDLIDLIYYTELRANEEGRLNTIYLTTPRTFKIFACLVLCTVPLLKNHAQTKQIFDELIDITKIDPTHLIELRLKYLRMILAENNKLVGFT